ncbi:MAG TPA: site-specific DNA-methyltransferase [Tepidisphaeraceae bacterium]|nr:site-specific DNA-methyltransferase [Tepidisphaeraceae bacterium]
MAKAPRNKKAAPKEVVTLKHDQASRKNIPTAEYESVMAHEAQSPIRVAYERRNRDLDPQLVWRGKDEQDGSDLVVAAPPLFIQEKVQPKALIDDLLRQSQAAEAQIDLFADFNGLPDTDARTEFYAHDAHWANRMILGDSLQVMASLAEREGLRGKVQCIYLDPPYGIKFNSNFQWSTTTRTVTDGKLEHITREPEQVKAFRDTWRDGIHSYLTYFRERLTAARDLLTETGSIFVQIGDENVHRLRAVMDEIFGDANAVSDLVVAKTIGQTAEFVPNVADYCLWYAKNKEKAKYRQLYRPKEIGGEGTSGYRFAEVGPLNWRPLTADEKAGIAPLPPGMRLIAVGDLSSQRQGRPSGEGTAMHFPVQLDGRSYYPSGTRGWSTTENGITRLKAARRIYASGGSGVGYVRFLDDFAALPMTNIWTDTIGQAQYGGAKTYVVQTATKVVERCVLMSTDPGDLVLDPTCGSGTTAYVAEQWGRRWITIDTSRVALALARARIMGARYPYYLKADSREGQLKEAEVTHAEPSTAPVRGDLRQGFVYERVPHITLKSIANNAEIDVIWEKFEKNLSVVRGQLSVATGAGKTLEEWEVPREADAKWPVEARKLLEEFWKQRIARQKEIDGSIASKAEFEFLYDKPYVDGKKVRVAGPFTVESLSPHRVMTVGADDELIDPQKAPGSNGDGRDFGQMILEHLRTAGVQQAHKENKIAFTSVTGWPGRYICGEARYADAQGAQRRAGIFIGPEFGTVARQDLVTAAREAGDANFDVVIACAFNYEAMASEFNKLGRIPVLKARMNAELHMGSELKNTGKGNLFVIFGEPDITLLPGAGGRIQVKINGVDVFHPNSGEVRSDGADGIACWFIDTDYNDESFFVRQAYFLGANDPYKALKTTLKAEINEDAWATLHSDTSRPFDKPAGGKIAVKVINHLGDEVMKVFRVE